jgi:predicted nucleotidyltransferase
MLKLSKNNILLLRLFYTNPDQAFYIQEIGRILNKKPGVFQRALYGMEKEGVLRSEYKANARYFRANEDYPLYQEYKSIVFKTIGVIGGLKGILENAVSIDFSFLYGSFAKGTETSLSDIDLIIVGSPDEDKIIRELENLEGFLKREINYKLYSSEEYVESIRRKDPFLMGILEDQKIMLIGEKDDLRKITEGSPHKKADAGSAPNQKPIE